MSRGWAESPLPINTVFIILMENHNWSDIKVPASCPYINTVLLPMASYCEQYYNPPGLHPSEPNYLWLEAGTNFGVLDDRPPATNHQSSTSALFVQLDAAGIPWKAYQEDITGTTCPDVNSGKYAVRHNPYVFFDVVRNNLSYCTNHIRPYTELATDLANNTVARYNFLTPNVTNDMHDAACTGCSTRMQGDHWLSVEIPKIMASSAYSNNGAIFITWDEGVSGDGPIGMIVLSPLAKGRGYSNSVHYTHSSALRTMQNIFGVRPYLGDAAKAIDLSDLFIIASPPSILTQPQDKMAVPGATATFTVGATGSTPLSFQWLKDGAPLTGATSAALTLSSVKASDEAGYTVVITNRYGSVTSAVATLTLILPPAIITQPRDTNAVLGATATFSVGAIGGAPLSYQWFFNGGPITRATNATLTLTNVQPATAGTYTVRVTNLAGSTLSSNASLTVILLPTVTITATDPSAAEAGLDPGTFTISRSGVTSLPLAVFFTVAGSATPGSDYLALASPVILQPGAASTNLTVAPVDDPMPEANETVIATLSVNSNYVVGVPGAAIVTITDDDNLPPSVTITNPAAGAVFTGPLNIPIQARASDSDGFVVRVDFFLNGTNKLGTVTTAPYDIIWTNALAGTNALTAVATDNLGKTGVSAPVSIYVNLPPSVSITAPANGASLVVPANVVITASAADNGSVTLVEFFVGGTLLGSRTSSPYTIPWTNVAIGDYVLTARATDNEGLTTLSVPVNVAVREPTPDFADNFNGRGLLTGFTNFVFGSTATYTREPGEPRHDGTFGTQSGWISWVAPASGACVMTTTTNGLTGLSNLFDTVLAVYTGDVVSNLTYIASNDDDPTATPFTSQSRVSFSAVAGATYQVAVDGYGAGQGGNIYFRMSLPNPVPTAPVVVRPPQTQVADPGSNAVFSVTVTGATPFSYQWQFNGANIAGATANPFTATNVQYTNAGLYSVFIGNSLGSTTSLAAELIVRPKITQGLVLNDGSFEMTINGTPGKAYLVDISTNLQTWRLLGSTTNVAVQTPYIDSLTPPSVNRAYRLRLGP